MLVLARHTQQGIAIGPDIRIWVSQIHMKRWPQVHLGIEAPRDIRISRFNSRGELEVGVPGQLQEPFKPVLRNTAQRHFRQELTQLRLLLCHMHEKHQRGEALTDGNVSLYRQMLKGIEVEAGL